MPKPDDDFTPMITQYLEIKRDCPDAILFFRLGDFYEMFFEDAKVASSALGLALTSREAGKDRRVPMCGIPYHAAENYISRLIAAAHKVAICEQLEDPKAAKGIVKRDIVRVITPGTLLNKNILSRAQNNYLASIYQNSSNEFGLAVVDVSTGEFKITQLDSRQKLISELTRLEPSELIMSEQLSNNLEFTGQIKTRLAAAVSEVEGWTYDYPVACEKLTSHFQIQSLRGFGCEEMPLAVSAAGAALAYLEKTQKTRLVHINKITPYSLTKCMVLDNIAQRNLELIRNLRGEKEGTLFAVLNFTRTAMGQRLLAQWIQQPLLEVEAINKRLDAVEELSRTPHLRGKLAAHLKDIVDIERLLGRISAGVAGARDMLSLNQSLKIIPQVKMPLRETKSALLKEIGAGLRDLENLTGRLDSALREDAPLSVREGRMIKKGFSRELDELLEITEGGQDWIAALQKKEIERTGINSLKVRYNRVFGYYIEITKANLHLAPQDYTRKQTLVNAERFITPELKIQEEKIISAQEKTVELEYQLFTQIRQDILEELSAIQTNAAGIAALDALNSLSEAAARNNYVRPALNNGCAVNIRSGRHPVLEGILAAGKFIPNDTNIDCRENQIAIITGPNMAGKSTYIRQVALLVVMSQIGSFIPAERAEIGIVDRIFTRVGAGDDISAGMSTFMTEMSETANILNNATSRSMIVLDEIGRGTSTFDGLSIAWATAEYLHKSCGPRPKTLFATHYHELAELELLLSGVKNYNVSVRERNDEVIFLYKLARGAADHSYGIYVARLAGLPKEVISRARAILSSLEINSISADAIPSPVKPGANKEKQRELFEQKESELVRELKRLDINRLTPLEALTRLNEWQEKLKNEPKQD